MPPVPPQAAALSAPSRREYAAMLLPFILSTVTQPLIGAVDTAVMGRLSDPSYIAGVAVGAVIFNTLYWLLGFLRVGSTGFSAQALATGDAEAAWKAFLLPGIMALLLGTLILLCRDILRFSRLLPEADFDRYETVKCKIASARLYLHPLSLHAIRCFPKPRQLVGVWSENRFRLFPKNTGGHLLCLKAKRQCVLLQANPL